MRKIQTLAFFAAAALLALTLTSCGKPTFGVTENTGKLMIITAERAGVGGFFLSGSLQAEDGEQIVITSSLTKGSVSVEIIQAPEEQSIDELPDFNGGAILTAEVSGTEETSGTVPAGAYYVRSTCLEKATGTIQIEVRPAAA